MTDRLSELVDLLSLERIDAHLFRGGCQDLGWGRLFGGQVLAQALSAALQTVDEARVCHSLHGYFLRAGDASEPVVLLVDPIRDGGSFTTRRVVARQHGRPIFNLAASFHAPEPGLHHAVAPPEAPGPEGIPSERELASAFEGLIPDTLFRQVAAGRPIEIRPVDPVDPLDPTARPPRRQVWFRAAGPLEAPPHVHQFLLAYASDFHFLATALQPHGRTWLDPTLQMASLDHAMWFHAPVDMNEWILYDVTSPWSGHARGLAHGRFWSRDGTLLASTAQEGLLRERTR